MPMSILDMMSDASWWFSTVIVGVLINLIAPSLGRLFRKIPSYFSVYFRMKAFSKRRAICNRVLENRKSKVAFLKTKLELDSALSYRVIYVIYLFLFVISHKVIDKILKYHDALQREVLISNVAFGLTCFVLLIVVINCQSNISTLNTILIKSYGKRDY